ncbi:MAG: alanine--tRNA ligase [Rickettsiales bacterium]|jgi:alanyl-tRNA synthetase|nr:alanine--tRNA ligase [Rickettsiales bacterium]
MFTVNEIRSRYLKFFEKKGCEIFKSSSLVPDDPTLLFTNSGMVQFKNYFKGIEKPKFTRIATAQKSMRAGGKHNDLDNVGYTARHHTFFEMLGNFSFGDYFKKEAITWAWEFLTKELQIPEEKLVVTIYHNDEEAYNIWKNEVGLSQDKIIRISTKDNFWEMGDTGPCGPCSEIFYDHGADISGGLPGSPEEDGDRYIEVWNIVFTQFSRNEKGELEELPNKCIDTGMGLERIAAVLQGVHNNYEIHLFKKLIDNSKNIVGGSDIFSHRIIADHLRSSSFLICDGVLPSNEGRGYVLRRIMRRAMLQVHKLGCNTTSMYKLVPCLVDIMGDSYPELRENESFIMETLRAEEDRFRTTLDKGLKRLEDKLKNVDNGILDGTDAFELYDTYGFPLDLTEILLKDKNISVDTDGFEDEMQKQRERAKANWVGSGDTKVSELYLKITEKVNFEGYDKTTTSGKILKLIRNNNFVNEVKDSEEIEIITDNTCFYGETGGQMGDTGVILLVNEDGSIPVPCSLIRINNTTRVNDLVIHKGVVEIGSFRTGDRVNLSIDRAKRSKIAANHSATHLLHFALKQFLGNGVNQKGSSTDDRRLRFDISYNGVIEKSILEKVEILVNSIIIENTEIKTETMDLEEAKKSGAVALFSEKYSKQVRVVSMGLHRNQDNNLNSYYSVELCGGTHVRRTGNIGFFKIVSEESIASGIRRIEALTGIEALKYVNEKVNVVNSLSKSFKTGDDKVIDKIGSLIKENKDLKKQIGDREKSKLGDLKFEERESGDIRVAYGNFDDVNPQDLKQVMIGWQNTRYKNRTVAVAICGGEKNVAMVAVSKDLSDKYNAVELLKNIGGKGGGAGGFAMGAIGGSISIDNIINKL